MHSVNAGPGKSGRAPGALSRASTTCHLPASCRIHATIAEESRANRVTQTGPSHAADALWFGRRVPPSLGIRRTLSHGLVLATQFPDQLGAVHCVTSGVVRPEGLGQHPWADDLHCAIGMQQEPEVIPRAHTEVAPDGRRDDDPPFWTELHVNHCLICHFPTICQSRRRSALHLGLPQPGEVLEDDAVCQELQAVRRALLPASVTEPHAAAGA